MVVPPLTARAVRRPGRGPRRLRRVQPARAAATAGPTTWSADRRGPASAAGTQAVAGDAPAGRRGRCRHDRRRRLDARRPDSPCNGGPSLGASRALGAHAPRRSGPGGRCRSTTSGTWRPTSGWSTRPTSSTPRRYEEWLELLTDDVHYLMPVRVTTALGAGYDTSPGMAHFDEDKYSLSRRVARFLTEHAWTEDPPSRLRHHLYQRADLRHRRTPTTSSSTRPCCCSAAAATSGRRRSCRPAARTCCAARRDGLEAGPPHDPGRRLGLRMQNLAIFL